MIATAAAARLIRELGGDVLEVGAGSGRNLPDYGPDTTLTALEPRRRARRRLARRARGAGRDVRVIPGRAERLPLPTASVDAVVATFVLCSVDDPALALAEIIRVLRPGGTLVFADHVAAEPGTRTRKLQDLVTVTTGPFGGCDQARDTAETIGRAGFEQVRYDQHVVAVPFGVRVPVIVGRATTSDRVAHAVAAPPT